MIVTISRWPMKFSPCDLSTMLFLFPWPDAEKHGSHRNHELKVAVENHNVEGTWGSKSLLEESPLLIRNFYFELSMSEK